MQFHLDLIEDKVEFFEASSLAALEKKIAEKIEQNRAILLSVHSVTHQMQMDADGHKHFSAVVHFKAK
ncbi:DUF2536 family protein [Bacillus badius]|uniref:DUF2536 domain-containing protein n=1 Tax=Bacillus badius TaxID=1455 RepID=A0ABR5ATG9_BACBA|nr:DUF2536 family protein [Bacillus badius]KIL75397.1 hypothetical protein SD78_2466 [Bacillus badius]KIL78040.1 hypothetical protein SD77_1019 [Bacillus badius]KZN98754.1 hypothetical protein A4244_06490 [Bacillus badius]KZR58443.1 hypothetical protein A3781_17820 [Bacillus badius]MED0666255.1 DUF2536 family protein [Bacillus badius]